MAGDRFSRKGIAKFKWVPTLTDSVSPYSVTRAEITGSVAIGVDVSDIGGMQFKNNPIPTPDFETTFVTSIPGEDTAEDPTLTFYERSDIPANQTIRNALAKANTGYILALPYGDIPTYELEIWKVTSTGVNRQWTAANEAAKYMATFAVTAVPTLNAIVPA